MGPLNTANTVLAETHFHLVKHGTLNTVILCQNVKAEKVHALHRHAQKIYLPSK